MGAFGEGEALAWGWASFCLPCCSVKCAASQAWAGRLVLPLGFWCLLGSDSRRWAASPRISGEPCCCLSAAGSEMPPTF